MRVFLGMAIALVSTAASAEFGSFSTYPQGEFILQEPRPIFRLSREFVFRDEAGVEWRVPAQEAVDGASIPQPAWSFIGGPFEGPYLYAAIVHDYFTCAKNRDFDETHDIFWRAMRATGVDAVKAWYMWAAVQFLGPPRWQVDDAATVAAPCRKPDEETATIFDGLADEDKAKALAKLTAVQRTLETSRGLVIDVVDGTVIEAGTEAARAHLDRLRQAAETNFAGRSQLGLATVPSEVELLDPELVAPWAKGDVVELDRYLESRNLPFTYAPVAQERFQMQDIDAVLPRLQILDFEVMYPSR